eukprot:s5350_g2.t1
MAAMAMLGCERDWLQKEVTILKGQSSSLEEKVVQLSKQLEDAKASAARGAEETAQLRSELQEHREEQASFAAQQAKNDHLRSEDLLRHLPARPCSNISHVGMRRLNSNVIDIAGAPPSESTSTNDAATFYYPVQLGLAYLFLVGYFARTIFLSAGLPPSVGVILVGFAFSYFFQYDPWQNCACDLLSARDELQELSFFLVLLIAGLEIRLKDLRSLA